MLSAEYDIIYPAGAERVAKALAEAGFECFAVGGCVRDSLLCREPSDWDFTTNATTDEMKSCFDAAGIHWASTGERHGTLTALVADESFEVTTYRTEGAYSDGRHPDEVVFARTLEDDLSRRDFTINAMAYAPKVGIVDVFGGQADLARGVVRAVGNPAVRFEEDGLRIMRALRLAAVLDFTIEPVTARALHECKGNLLRVSVERVFVEISRFLQADDGKRVAELLREFPDVLAPIFSADTRAATTEGADEAGNASEAESSDGQNASAHSESAWQNAANLVAKTPPDLVVRFAALFVGLFAKDAVAGISLADSQGALLGVFPKSSSEPQDSETVHAVYASRGAHDALRKLKSPKRLATEVSRLVQLAFCGFAPTALGARRLIAACGSEAAVFRLLALYRAQGRSSIDETEALVCDQMAKGAPFGLKDLALKGDDLIKLGMPAGSEIGACLNWLFGQVIEGGSLNRKNELLRLATRFCEGEKRGQ